MSLRAVGWFRFHMERWLQRGVLAQLGLMAAVIVGVAVTGGLVAWIGTEGTFSGPAAAVWWAFLRLTDPGYLGDDEGVFLRAVSTTVTIAGYVLFMGTLIAIMTQWLLATMRLLEAGLTPITMSGHVVILGWTNRTPEVIARLLRARGRLVRFLDQHDARTLRVVVLAEKVDAALHLELREYLGEDYTRGRIFLRSGTAMEPDDLRRLDIARAAAVILPASEHAHGGSRVSDTRVVKALLTLREVFAGIEVPPRVVVEVLDLEKVPIIERTLESRLEVVATDDAMGRLISQSVRHERLMRILRMLVSRRASLDLFVRAFPERAGSHPTAWNLGDVLPHAVALGAVRREDRRWVAHINPGAEFRLREDDLVLFLGPSFAACVPKDGVEPPALVERPPEELETEARVTRRVLVLGYGHLLGALLVEFAECTNERFDVTVVSVVPEDDRVRWLDAFDVPPDRVRVGHVVADFAQPKVLRSLDLARFDRVVFLPSQAQRSIEEADARTVLAFVLVRSLIADLERPPSLTVNLIDPDNERLLESERATVLVSPHVSSHLLAQVALRPELNCVYALLLSAEGSEVDLRTPGDFGERAEWSYDELQRAAIDRGWIVLGRFAPDDPVEPLRAFDRTRPVRLEPSDEVVVLTSPD